MQIVVTSENDTYSLEVSEDLELENFKVLCEAESGISSSDIIVTFNGGRLTEDKKSLKEYGIQNGDLIMVVSADSLRQRAAQRSQTQPQPMPASTASSDVRGFDFSSILIPSSSPNLRSSGPANSSESRRSSNTPAGQGGEDDPAVIRDMLLANPEQLSLLKHNNPKLADALVTGDLESFAKVLREQQDARRDRERQRIRLLSADPFDMEAQRLIAQEIQQENINANMEAAMEFNPESFGTVHMLYIHCLVNGHPVKAFIDSGAQTTIMSQACAERCNIMRLVDTRWAGIAKGVGTQKIIGRVHMGQIQIEGDFLASSFSILEEQPMDMLLGLDMLRRHQMSIDLKSNELLIGTTGTRTQFLNESELPDCARLTPLTEDEVLKRSEMTAKQTEDEELAKALAESAQAHQAGQSTSTPASGSGSTGTKFPESDVKELMQIGFSREEVIAELQKQNGNKTQAIAALFAKSFQAKKT